MKHAGALHWPRVTDISGITTYRLKAWKREMSTRLRSLVEHGRLYLYLSTCVVLQVVQVCSLYRWRLALPWRSRCEHVNRWSTLLNLSARSWSSNAATACSWKRFVAFKQSVISPVNQTNNQWFVLSTSTSEDPEPASVTRYHCTLPLPHRWLHLNCILYFTCIVSTPYLDFPQYHFSVVLVVSVAT